MQTRDQKILAGAQKILETTREIKDFAPEALLYAFAHVMKNTPAKTLVEATMIAKIHMQNGYKNELR